MEGLPPPPRELGCSVFDKHFKNLLDEPTFKRARQIFGEVGWYNEGSLAIQFYTALKVSRLNEVLDYYEQLLHAETGLIATVPGPLELVLELKACASHVYGNVIAQGDFLGMLELRASLEIPEEFYGINQYTQQELKDLN